MCQAPVADRGANLRRPALRYTARAGTPAEGATTTHLLIGLVTVKQKIISHVISGAIGAVIGFFLDEIPVGELWIDVAGSREEKALKKYRDHQSKISRRDSLQIVLPWKAEQDSLRQVREREAILCIKRERDRGKENPCASSIYYYQVSDSITNIDLGSLGELEIGLWLIGSTECPRMFPIDPLKLPSVLLNKDKRYFATPIAREAEIARILGLCQ